VNFILTKMKLLKNRTQKFNESVKTEMFDAVFAREKEI